MGVWNIGKLDRRTSSTLREWVMYPPPRRLRYRTNLFVIWVWYKEMMTYCCVTMYLEVPCPVRVEIPKYNCYSHFYVNNVNDSLQLFFRVWRRMQLWCGRNVLLTPISTWMRLEVESPLVWNLWILLPMGLQNIWRLASGAAAAWSILEGCCLFHAWEAMVVIWTMIDDMRSWFRRAEFDPLWVLRHFWFVEEEDRLQLSQMKCYSGSVCSCKVYGSCRGIYGRPPRN